jgi:hypothetical protein
VKGRKIKKVIPPNAKSPDLDNCEAGLAVTCRLPVPRLLDFFHISIERTEEAKYHYGKLP